MFSQISIVCCAFYYKSLAAKVESSNTVGNEVTISGTRMIVGLMKIGALDRWTQGW